MKYQDALEKASKRSAEFNSTVYVSAILSDGEHPTTGEPYIEGYVVTDRYGYDAVAKFHEGWRRTLVHDHS